MKHFTPLRSLVYAPLLATALTSVAEPKDVDSILDKLERQLLDQEQASLNFGSSKKSDTKADRQMNFATEAIVAPPQDKLSDISKATDQLNAAIEKLASETERQRQKILEEANLQNHVELWTGLAEPDKSQIRFLKVKIDGFEVYATENGLWLPRGKLPLFTGPIRPGTHRIDLEARVARRSQDVLPLTEAGQLAINESFDVHVGTGKSTWLIKLAPFQADNMLAKAELTDAK